ncbi:MAG: polysaccharide biosynthesis protein [Lachnospiraceae bacterium]|jgi:stage V sporulation protein B|nr:polysaccharide biosynthesis protein [Lachnospiraceae bacterium]
MAAAENKKSSSNSILVQGSILVVTSFVSRLIGLCYRFPLTRIVGKVGMDYYGTAYSIYSILLVISTYSVPTAISKMISEREAVGETENAKRIFKGSLILMTSVGLFMSLLFYFGADFLAASVQTPMAASALRVLAPVLLVTSIVGVIRGFFQGFNTMVPTAVSQIIEQIANAVVSVLAAYELYHYGDEVETLLNQPHMSSAYGAAGGTLGTVVGAIAALIFLLFLLVPFLKSRNRRKVRSNQRIESNQQILYIMLATIFPMVLNAIVYNITSVAEMYVFKNIAVVQKYSATQISLWWMAYSQEFIVVQNLPVTVANSLASPIVPSLAESYAQKDRKAIRSKINSTTRFIMAIVLPITVGMMVISGPIIQLLFGDGDITSARIMTLGALSVPFYSLSSLSSSMLQGINKLRIPVKVSLITLFAHMGLLTFLLLVFRMNIFAVVIAYIFDGFLMAFLNNIAVRKYTKTRYQVGKTFLIPLFSSVVMGAAVFAAYHILFAVLGRNSIATLVSILVGIIVYAAVILKTGGITENELKRLPKGNSLCRLARRMHLFP